MQDEIELFADTLLMLFMALVSIILMRIDPLLPLLWGCATFFMTQVRRS